jgi:hypothetical protein
VLSQWADFCRLYVEEPKKLSRDGNRYLVYEAVDESPGFRSVEKEVGEKGDAFWEASSFEEVLEGMRRKKEEMKELWTGPRRGNKSVL